MRIEPQTARYRTRGFSEGDLEDATGAEGESSQGRQRVVVRKKYVGRKHLADGKQQGFSRYSGPVIKQCQLAEGSCHSKKHPGTVI